MFFRECNRETLLHVFFGAVFLCAGGLERDADIRRSLVQRLQHARLVVDNLVSDLGPGVFLLQFLHHPHGGEDGDRRDGERARASPLRTHLFHHLALQVHDALRVLGDRASLLVQFDAVLFALEERSTDFVFQLLERATHRRLRSVELVRYGRKGPVFQEPGQQSQDVSLDKHKKSLLGRI